MGDRLRLSKAKKMDKKLRKKKEDTGKWDIDFGQLNVYRPPHHFIAPHQDVYEEARQNKAYYDSCRQNVINGERAEHMRKSLFWLKISSILLCISFCWSLTCSFIKVGDVFLVASVIWFGLAVVSTGVHIWHEMKIKKLVNVK